MTLSRMSADQAGAAAALIRQTIESLSYYNERAKQEELAKYGARELEQLTAEDPDSVLLATSDGELVGFCVSRYDDGLIWLSWFGVRSSHRRAGIGAKLLTALAETLPRRRAHKVWCDTRTANEASAQVLTRAGFQRLAELRNHWYGQDFYLWEWLPR